jgi:hypothetical protein
VWQWLNSRSRIPNVDGAYTAPNSFFMPPARITSRSSTLSAPAAMPAITAVSFGAGFAAPERTRSLRNTTRCSSRSGRPVCSANAITGTSPAQDTRFSSSNTAVPRRQS